MRGRMCRACVLRIFAHALEYFARRLTAITWLQEFVELGRDKMMPYAASVLGAILPCLSHSEERVALVALRCDLLLRPGPCVSPHAL